MPRDLNRLGAAHDVLPLRQHRPLVALDAGQRDAGALGDLLGGRAGADLRLNLAWREVCALAAGAQGPLGRGTRDGTAQGLVEGQPEGLPVRAAQYEVRAVLVDADEPQLLHIPVRQVPH